MSYVARGFARFPPATALAGSRFEPNVRLIEPPQARGCEWSGGREGVYQLSFQPRGTSASARTGLPVPPVSFSGATTNSAPLGGNEARFASCVTPYFPAPRR